MVQLPAQQCGLVVHIESWLGVRDDFRYWLIRAA
jgi:hypothetical protein